MQGIEEAYCDLCIRAVLGANKILMETSAGEAISPAGKYGKGDTLSLDAIPEIAIGSSIGDFDGDAILVTEELGIQLANRVNANGREPNTIFFCDPTDRSTPLREFLQRTQGPDPGRRVGDIVAEENAIRAWEETFTGPATITGACSAITCVREGLPIFSVTLNYITQELVLVCGAGIKLVKLPQHLSREYEKITTGGILERGREICIRTLRMRKAKFQDGKTFITFLGKAGYKENFRDCGIFGNNEDRQPIYENPGGPTRVLYLSDLYETPLGFTLSNGEKIGEWLHWLAYVRFAKANGERVLNLFEVTHDRPWTKDGISMAPSPAYSIFRAKDGGPTRLDVRPLSTLPRPSQFRSTLVVAPADNSWILQLMKRCRHRMLLFD